MFEQSGVGVGLDSSFVRAAEIDRDTVGFFVVEGSCYPFTM
jgi:hypothetical protein